MILLDAIYINNSGGKVLLDYLIEVIEGEAMDVFYLLDIRVKDNHPQIKSKNKILYSKSSLLVRHKFYLQNSNKFNKVLCFGNLPPSIKTTATVYTYFHQKLFLEVPSDSSFKNKFIFFIKSLVFQYLKKNTSFWLVQTESMKSALNDKNIRNVTVIPFYPSLKLEEKRIKRKGVYIYVSSGAPHKNHLNLLDGFVKFYDKHKVGELHLTVSSEFNQLLFSIEKLVNQGYPIINHGFISRNKLAKLYGESQYAIYPSLSESFGLGIIEALEKDCKIIGANLAYTYSVCEPSLVFNPKDVYSILKIFELSLSNDVVESKQIVFNEINGLLKLLK